MDIEIPQSAGRVCLFTCAGAGERIHKKVEMADQMKRAAVRDYVQYRAFLLSELSRISLECA